MSFRACYGEHVEIDPPVKISTPYGGRLVWKMPGGNEIIVHLKDMAKIRHKKRWSQVTENFITDLKANTYAGKAFLLSLLTLQYYHWCTAATHSLSSDGTKADKNSAGGEHVQ